MKDFVEERDNIYEYDVIEKCISITMNIILSLWFYMNLKNE